MDGNRLRDEIVASVRAEIDQLGNPTVCLATVLVGAFEDADVKRVLELPSDHAPLGLMPLGAMR